MPEASNRANVGCREVSYAQGEGAEVNINENAPLSEITARYVNDKSPSSEEVNDESPSEQAVDCKCAFRQGQTVAKYSHLKCFSIVIACCVVALGVWGMVGLLMTSTVVDEAWQNTFLPSYVTPISYDIWLNPNFYRDSDMFNGYENITFIVHKDTNHIIVHCKEMVVTNVQVTMVARGLSVKVNRRFMFPIYQYLVVETKETLLNGSMVILYLAFVGSLNGTNGYFKSTYINRLTGTER